MAAVIEDIVTDSRPEYEMVVAVSSGALDKHHAVGVMAHEFHMLLYILTCEAGTKSISSVRTGNPQPTNL